jgi:hypothetical protein
VASKISDTLASLGAQDPDEWVFSRPFPEKFVETL